MEFAVKNQHFSHGTMEVVMKRHSLLIFSLILLGIALYTVNTYDPNGTKAKTTANSTENGNNEKTQNSSETTSDKSAASDTSLNTQNSTMTYEKAQDFTLVDLEGNEVSLSDYKGKKVFLNFWATWCPPCKAEMPEIEKVYQESKDSDLVVLAVEIGEPLDTVKTFIDNNGYNFKVLLDLDQSVAASYGISAIPASFFIDEDGNIVDKRVGGMNYDEMKEYIAKLDK
jgi:peroxiredoxin